MLMISDNNYHSKLTGNPLGLNVSYTIFYFINVIMGNVEDGLTIELFTNSHDPDTIGAYTENS